MIIIIFVYFTLGFFTLIACAICFIGKLEAPRGISSYIVGRPWLRKLLRGGIIDQAEIRVAFTSTSPFFRPVIANTLHHPFSLIYGLSKCVRNNFGSLAQMVKGISEISQHFLKFVTLF